MAKQALKANPSAIQDGPANVSVKVVILTCPFPMQQLPAAVLPNDSHKAQSKNTTKVSRH
jgi:hypothetical protein